jgi:hypothetical protein
MNRNQIIDAMIEWKKQNDKAHHLPEERYWDLVIDYMENELEFTHARLLMDDIDNLKDQVDKLNKLNEHLRKELSHALGFHD